MLKFANKFYEKIFRAEKIHQSITDLVEQKKLNKNFI